MGHSNNPVESLSQWQTYLLSVHPNEIELGLERAGQVMQRLNIGSQALKIVVGGTNGKGSTSALLESILLASGYRVGVYGSPHLIHFNERFRLQGEQASDEQIIRHLQKVDEAREGISLTYFEFATLAAFSLFAEQELDVWILEVGLGGRLDAVNLIDADCSVLTQIDIDHQEYLGSDREQIGLEKAAIFRAQKPAICADSQAPQSVLEYAQRIGARLWLLDRDFSYEASMHQWMYRGPGMRRGALPYPALRGANQLNNASAALAVIEAFADRLAVPIQDIKQGLLDVRLPGRFQVLAGQPLIILDVAHNPHALQALAYNLQQISTTGRTIAVVGMLKDKEVQKALAHMTGEVDVWHCAQLDSERSLPVDQLSTFVKEAYAQEKNVAITKPAPVADQQPTVRPRVAPREKSAAHIECFDSIVDAFLAAQQISTVNDKIVVFGSFLAVGPVLEHVQKAGGHEL
ncbi:MAG TPA: bifunctional tetrahydrofolate synthase/dihydrofolate synthase [Paenalcaligenes sp.]|nr:bifunctional tetrahydrofolate synthase/dihydrofolate synthase [Paenalcaligenes sp.]